MKNKKRNLFVARALIKKNPDLTLKEAYRRASIMMNYKNKYVIK